MINPIKMRGGVLFITTLFILGSYAQRENFINEGNENLDESEVQLYEFNFGSNWRGPSPSTVYIDFSYDQEATTPFGEPDETFRFYPPGETGSIPLTFSLQPEDFTTFPFVFPVIVNDPRVCPNITKRAPTNQISIQGGPSCNGGYEYQVTVGERYDVARSNIEYTLGSPPDLVESSQVLTPAPNTFYGKLGATFQVGVEGTETVIINATDFQGEPRGSIRWYFRAGGTGAETLLPGSLAGVTITDAGDGQSTLSLSGVNTAHVGQYIARATNEHGEDSASAFVTQGVGPFIIEGSGQSDSSSFRVGANRNVNPGETITIRAEDRQSDPSSTITWSYSRSESGPYSVITSGGPYSISSSSGSGNVGTNSSLRISNVGPGQYGYYRAEAVNPQGTYISSSSLVGRCCQLNLGSGIETDGDGNIGSDFNTNLGSTVTIRASDLTGFPTCSFRWQRFTPQGVLQDITSGGRYRITTNGPNSVLTITGVTQIELGTYRVTATNVLQCPGDSQAESLVGTPSSCNTGTNIVRVNNGATYESGAIFDTTNANSFRIRASDPTGVPTGTSSFQYSRTLTGAKLSVNRIYATTTTPIGATGLIDFFNLVDGAYGYYFVTNTNQFGSAECVNCVGSQLVFRTGSGEIGQNYQVTPGASQTITASFSDGFPYGAITWRGPDGRIITSAISGYTITQGGNSQSRLVIDSARSGTDYGTYTATASNLFGSVSASSVLSETVVVTAPVIDAGNSSTVNEASDGVVQGSISESFRAAPGENVTIEVNDIAGQESSSIRFFRSAPGSTQFIEITNNPAYTIVTSQNANGFTNARISFIAGPNTYGTFKAVASNSAGSDEAISIVGQQPRVKDSDSFIVIRNGQSRTLNVGGDINNIVEGASLTLNAGDVEGQPDREFIWTYRRGTTGQFGNLPTSSKIFQFASLNVGTLGISNIDSSLYGEYRVVARNRFGVSTPVITKIGGPPIIIAATGTVIDGPGMIGNNFIQPREESLTITACVESTYPPADPTKFMFLEGPVELEHVQQDDNCFIYQEGEFEFACRTTITARAENVYGNSNEPSSVVTLKAPTIIRGTRTCTLGGATNTAQIGSQLCLYQQTTFKINCSVNNTNIPNFVYEWEFNGVTITNSDRKYSNDTRADNTASVLTVLGGELGESGRYTCRVRGDCNQTDSASTDVDTFEYSYTCNQDDFLVCSESRNGGPFRTVPNSICEGSSLDRPNCNPCNWETTQWTKCSDTSCHRGRIMRTVQCSCDGEVTDDLRCQRRSPKPDGMERCGPAGVRCNRPYAWKAYQFGTCSRTCGPSYRDRIVECVSTITGNRVNDDECTDLFKPDPRISCQTQDCDDCMNRYPDSECRMFVLAANGCDDIKYNTRFECCRTCRELGL